MSSIIFGDVVGKLGFSYGSVDLRLACFRADKEWISFLASIRFSDRDTATLAREQPKNIETPEFKVTHWALEFDKWDKVRNGLLTGSFEFHDDTILFDAKTEINSISCHLASSYSSYFLDCDWPIYKGSMARRPSRASDPQRWQRTEFELKKLNYKDAYQAISESLGVRFSQNMNAECDVLVGAPVYAKITDMDFDGENVSVDLTFHENLRKSRLVTELFQSEDWAIGGGKKKNSFVNDLNTCEVVNENGFVRTTVTRPLIGADPSDMIETRLLVDGLPLFERSNQVIRLLQRHPSKLFGTDFPLARVLDRFCSIEELSKQLLSPEDANNSSHAFERAVTWLLATSNCFIAIKLDKHDFLRVRETSFNFGAVDLLAYSMQTPEILLISCKTNVPDDTQIARIKECSSRLTKEGLLGNLSKLTPVLATPRTIPQSIAESAKREGVRILDRNDLSNLLEWIRVGEVRRVREFWQGSAWRR